MKRSRALVPALSLTLLCSWGSLYYAFAVLVRPLQAELGWSAGQAMGAYSLALVAWGLCTYPVGQWVDRHGGRHAMSFGSCLCAALFVALSRSHSLWAFYAVWAGLGAGMALTLYEPAFAVLVDAYPGTYRKRIGVLTLAGGLASTAFWPLTHWLVAALGWRDTLLVFAALHLLLCAPLHWLLLPRASLGGRPPPPADATPPTAAASSVTGGFMRQPAFWLLAFCFVAFGLVTSALAMHMIPLLESRGVEPALAVTMAALVGPMQVAGRSTDFMLGGRVRPLVVGAITVALIPLALVALLIATRTFPLLVVFIVAYGAGLGLLTIVRATTPVEVFGNRGYAAVGGALGGPAVLARAAGPLLMTCMLPASQHYDGALWMLLAVATAGALAYLLVMRKKHP